MLQVLLAYIMFSILSEYFDKNILILFLLLLIFIFILIGNRKKDNVLYFLERTCDIDKYMTYVNENLKKENDSRYYLYLTYGHLFNGDFKALEDNIYKIDPNGFKSKEILIYEELKLKLLYNNREIEEYEKRLNDIYKKNLKKSETKNLNIFKAPLLLLEEDYEKLIDLMFDLIPKQRYIYRVIELEYYLSIAYLALNKDDDALAVLKFITKRDYKLYHVTEAEKLLNTLKSNQL